MLKLHAYGYCKMVKVMIKKGVLIDITKFMEFIYCFLGTLGMDFIDSATVLLKMAFSQ